MPDQKSKKTTFQRSGWTFDSLDEIPTATLRRNFDADGFLCLTSVFSPSLVSQLRDAARINLADCFRVLHDGGHTQFPHCFRRRLGGDDDDEETAASAAAAAAAAKEAKEAKENKPIIEYALDPGVKGGYREVVMRSPGRFEVPYGCDRAPFTDGSVRENVRLLEVVGALLSDSDSKDQQVAEAQDDDNDEEKSEGEAGCTKKDDEDDDDDDNDVECPFYLCNISIVTAIPSSTDQPWHADGGHVDLQTHQPCHCLNVFIPLVDIDATLGPTELRPASHKLTRNLAPMMLAARARGTLRKPVVPLLKAGDALLFDYRVLHRGRANLSGSVDRPILVLTYARRWFKDLLNFPKRSVKDAVCEEEEEEE